MTRLVAGHGGRGHAPAVPPSARYLAAALALILAFMAAEVTAGISRLAGAHIRRRPHAHRRRVRSYRQQPTGGSDHHAIQLTIDLAVAAAVIPREPVP